MQQQTGIYPYVWFLKSRLPERRWHPCRVFARSKGSRRPYEVTWHKNGDVVRYAAGSYWKGMNSIGVEFEDGFRVITMRTAVRKKKEA